jgi:hypothetical protein
VRLVRGSLFVVGVVVVEVEVGVTGASSPKIIIYVSIFIYISFLTFSKNNENIKKIK